MSIETGLAAILDGLDGLRASEGWPDTINPDVAIIEGPGTFDDGDIAGCHVFQQYDVTLLFSLTSGISRARARVMPYLAITGAKSIRAALYAAPTLGGNVQAFLWRGIVAPPGRISIFGKGLEAEIPVAEYYGATLQIECVS